MIDLDRLINEFDNKRETHPRLVSLWINYLLTYKNKFEKISENCESILSNIDNFNDITDPEILTLIILLT